VKLEALPEVTLEISEDSRENAAKSLEEKREQWQAQQNMFLEQVQAAREQGEAIADHWRRKAMAIRISLRIANGDNVPKQDHRFLADFDIGMYKQAMQMRMISENNDPEDYDSLAEGLEENSQSHAQAVEAGGVDIQVSEVAAE